jgi:Squalene-hopene cyclase C-terminal domain
MADLKSPVTLLADDEVRKFFLRILESSIPAEEKYDKILEFLQLESQLAERVVHQEAQRGGAGASEVLSAAAQDLGIWQPEVILAETRESVRRAVRRLAASQHRDGGWGFRVEESDFWGTGYAFLCLLEARGEGGEGFAFDVDLEPLLAGGARWIEGRPGIWSVDRVPAAGGLSLYEVTLAMRCFFAARQGELAAMAAAAAAAVERIVEAQNPDGGWDAKLWGPAIATPTGLFSEVGATSLALQALAASGAAEAAAAIGRAQGWLAATQNADGSWNDGSCHPEQSGLGGQPTLNKTCDALQGFLAGDQGDPLAGPFRAHIEKGVEWLRNQERPMYGDDRRIAGWGWQDVPGVSAFLYESTCLTVETLVKIPRVSFAVLTSNALWLTRSQYRRDGDPEDGTWKGGHTARIGLSLLEFYRRCRANALFDAEPGR